METINYQKNIKIFNDFLTFEKVNRYFFIHQNVRITQALTVLPERLRTLVAFLVTMESDLAGFVSKGPPVQECQLSVHLNTDVVLMQAAG